MRVLLIALLTLGGAWNLPAAEDSPFKSLKEKASYALGADLGKKLKQNGAEIDTDVYMKALKEAMSGAKPLMTDEQMAETMRAFSADLKTRLLDKNKKEGESFLAENKKKEGVQTTASGLQYQIVTKGTGKLPTSNDTVVCHYRGTLISGEEFDSSYKKGEPIEFRATGVIRGWTEALLMMPVGSKWKLAIPSDLAYGERGQRGIPPNAALLFDIELVSIKDPSAVPAPAANPAANPAGGSATPRIQLQPQPKPAVKPK